MQFSYFILNHRIKNRGSKEPGSVVAPTTGGSNEAHATENGGSNVRHKWNKEDGKIKLLKHESNGGRGNNEPNSERLPTNNKRNRGTNARKKWSNEDGEQSASNGGHKQKLAREQWRKMSSA
ncbi:hypothetical protein LR48_Vigan02g113500 [Vigna angularis]|uniref:Uncharacterized protein n=1 Tax=Phaseolus angularis TaxID=3914 RepID=A0A0L9TWT0_PHAAN|nr:hypothetical protein LR48_Vigan02g113500 [Vigna angularis]